MVDIKSMTPEELHPAPHLAGNTHCIAVLVAHEHRLHAVAVGQVQRAILDVAAGYIKPGGVLLYSTCTLLRRENEGVVEGFLRDRLCPGDEAKV